MKIPGSMGDLGKQCLNVDKPTYEDIKVLSRARNMSICEYVRYLVSKDRSSGIQSIMGKQSREERIARAVFSVVSDEAIDATIKEAYSALISKIETYLENREKQKSLDIEVLEHKTA